LSACSAAATDLTFDCAGYCFELRDELKDFDITATQACALSRIRSAKTCGACEQAFDEELSISFTSSVCKR
jgi:hypothetical protein